MSKPKNKPMKAPTASWPLPSLWRSLARAGFGDLTDHEPGLRTVLRALVDRLPDLEAAGPVTQEQLREAAGLKDVRWVRYCLKKLETLGLVTVTSGGYAAGRRLPSFVRVNKRALVDLIMRARARAEGVRKAYQQRTRDRIVARESRGAKFARPGMRRRRSDLPEVSSGLHPKGSTPDRPKAVSGAVAPATITIPHWRDLDVPKAEAAKRTRAPRWIAPYTFLDPDTGRIFKHGEIVEVTA